jgi:hypothetical protein
LAGERSAVALCSTADNNKDDGVQGKREAKVAVAAFVRNAM